MKLLGVWIEVKNNHLDEWKDRIKVSLDNKNNEISHNQIRASIVHSMPKDKKIMSKPEELKKDSQKKREILKTFKADPFTTIKDILEKATNHYGLK